MSTKIIFLDVDGTLIDCLSGLRRVPDSTRKAIANVKKNGSLVVLATGRPKAYLGKDLLNLGFDALITCNGTYIEKNNKVLYNRQIEPAKLRAAIDFFQRMQLEFILESQSYAYFSNLQLDLTCRFVEKYAIPERNLIDQWDIDSVVANKMVVFTTNRRQAEDCVRYFKNDFNLMNHPGEDSFDINLKNYTKAGAVERLLAYLNVPGADTYAIGDGINDIEMLQMVNHGIAMGNANAQLKKVANFVTTDIGSNGIYNALQRYNLF
jgi:Cof subfamily protein (haloacid dehalogenase superfamily)